MFKKKYLKHMLVMLDYIYTNTFFYGDPHRDQIQTMLR